MYVFMNNSRALFCLTTFGNIRFISQPQKGPGAKIEIEKSAKSLSTKNTKCLCKSTCYAVTNLELTSSRILSLLSLNSYTSIAGTVTPRMLSKQKNTHTILLSSKITPPELDDRILCMEDFCKYTEMSPRRRRYFIRSLLVSILLKELALPR